MQVVGLKLSKMRDDSFKVLLLGGNVDDGCGFYRIHEPMRVALDYGINVEYDDGLDSDALLHPDGSVDIRSVDYHGADLVVFQRPVTPGVYEAIRWLQNRGVACAVEMDDDLMSMHKDNMAYTALNPKYSTHENWDWFKKSAEIADLVICSTPALANRYAKHGRFVVLRNKIPQSYLDTPLPPTPDLDNLRVGWTGTLQNHPEDLHTVGGHLEAALQGRDFFVVGDGLGVKEALGMSGEVHATGWVHLDEYIDTMRNHMDIGIVPLEISAFNQAKSHLKGLEMSSQGIPCVVPNTDEYQRYSQETGTLLAKKPRDWQKHVKNLLNSVDRFEELRYTARDNVKGVTYENNVDLWVNAWKLAIKNRHETKK